jgi:tetratricopeptide (TPR) repeat protein
MAAALTEYRDGERLVRALAAEYPAVPQYRRDLAVSHNRVGRVLTLAGRPAEALDELERGRSVFEALVQASPEVPNNRDDLASALIFTSDALRDLVRSAEARDRVARAVALASAQPKAPAYSSRLAEALRRLARLKLDAGDAAGAVADARRAIALLEGLTSRDGGQWFGLACARATLAVAAAGEGDARSAAASPLADRAMGELRRAVAMGYRNPAQYRYEPALGPLRPRADFGLLILDLSFPADPFAR